MIRLVSGDILNATEDIIIHQTNCFGIMGGGLARQIKERYPEVYIEYNDYCRGTADHKRSLLGTVLMSNATDGKIIANLFGQFTVSPNPKFQATDYEALKSGLNAIKALVKYNNSPCHKKSLALPWNIGCGLGGGDWYIVHDIITEVFDNPDDGYDVTIYKLLGV